jgi:hypothetical protein
VSLFVVCRQFVEISRQVRGHDVAGGVAPHETPQIAAGLFRAAKTITARI